MIGCTSLSWMSQISHSALLLDYKYNHLLVSIFYVCWLITERGHSIVCNLFPYYVNQETFSPKKDRKKTTTKKQLKLDLQFHSLPVLFHVSYVVTTFLSVIAVFLCHVFVFVDYFAWDRHINICELLCNPNVDSKLIFCSAEISQTPTSDLSHHCDTLSSELCSYSTMSWWVGGGYDVGWMTGLYRQNTKHMDTDIMMSHTLLWTTDLKYLV